MKFENSATFNRWYSVAGILIILSFSSFVHGAVYTVTSSGNNNAGSLRRIVDSANLNPNVGGPDTIRFNIAGGPFTLTPGVLLSLTEAVYIDGFSEPGSSPNTLTNGNNTVHMIEVTHSSPFGNVFSVDAEGVTIKGLKLTSTTGEAAIAVNARNCTIQGCAVFGNGGRGIEISTAGNRAAIGGSAAADRVTVSLCQGSGISIDADSCTVQGSFVGTDSTGTQDNGNSDNGISISASGQFNTIGSNVTTGKNVCSGNGRHGISVLGTDNSVLGNIVGASANLATIIANDSNGIDVSGLRSIIGGTFPSNIVRGHSGGTRCGIRLSSSADRCQVTNNFLTQNGKGLQADADTTIISGNVLSANTIGCEISGVRDTARANKIGTDSTGSSDNGNSDNGLQITATGQFNVVGGNSPAERNICSGNGRHGIFVAGPDNTILGNIVGASANLATIIANDSNGIDVSGLRSIIGGTFPSNIVRGHAGFSRRGIRLSVTADRSQIRNNYVTQNELGLRVQSDSSVVSGNVLSANNTGCEVIGIFDTIIGNFIGTDSTGMLSLGSQQVGLLLGGFNVVGGLTMEPGKRNIISGNLNGVVFNGQWSKILSNYIGCNRTGNGIIGNGIGIFSASPFSENTVIGTPSARCYIVNDTSISTDGISCLSDRIAITNCFVGVLPNNTSHKQFGRGVFLGGSNCSISGCVVSSWNDVGIQFGPGAGDTISGTYVGTDTTGNNAFPNGYGVILDNSFLTQLGIPGSGRRNIISGNRQAGVLCSGTDSVRMVNNIVGMNATMTALLPNDSAGLVLQSTFRSRIGDGTVAGRNYLCGGDSGAAISMVGINSFPLNHKTFVLGNYIGIDSARAHIFVSEYGIACDSFCDTSTIGAIGFTGADSSNIITGAAKAGIWLKGNNLNNIRIFGNSIYGNGGLGIDLGPNPGVNPNDTGDVDAGENLGQNYPVLDSAIVSDTFLLVFGSLLNALSGPAYRLDLYENQNCDASGFGEGERHLGVFTVISDISGVTQFALQLPLSQVDTARTFTATATGPSGVSGTSEFSNCIPLTIHTSCCVGTVGNLDCDLAQNVDIGDLTVLVDNLFISFAPLCCPAEANVDGSPGVDIGDLTTLVDNLFISFTALPPCP